MTKKLTPLLTALALAGAAACAQDAPTAVRAPEGANFDGVTFGSGNKDGGTYGSGNKDGGTYGSGNVTGGTGGDSVAVGGMYGSGN